MSIYIGTSPLKAAYVGTTPVKEIYVGTTKVRPTQKVIECDFTQSDYGFTYVGGNSAHGQNSEGLWQSTSSGQYRVCAWEIPNNIYSQGELQKVEMDLYGTQAGAGGGITQGTDTNTTRVWQNVLETYAGTSSTVTLSSNTPANTNFKLTIDLDGGKMYISTDTTKILNLPSTNVSNIKNYWANGTLNICSMMLRPSGTAYAYIRKATFYVK